MIKTMTGAPSSQPMMMGIVGILSGALADPTPDVGPDPEPVSAGAR